MTGLRVAIVGINFAPEATGIAPYTTGLATGLRERGHDVRVVTAFPHYPEWKVPDGYDGWTMREQVDGLSVTRLRHYVPSHPKGLARLASEVSFGARCSALSRLGADVLLLPSPALISSAMVQARFSRGRRRPRVGVIVQDLYSSGLAETMGPESRVTKAMTALEARTLQAADGVAVIHERFRKRVVESLGVDDGKVRVIRNWSHVTPDAESDRRALRQRMGWSDDEFVVLHSGAMAEKQGLRNVVEAARLADQRGNRVRCVLMGSGGQQTELERASTGVERLEMLPTVPESIYPATLEAADLLLVHEKPGFVESGVPSKLTSYFSCGVAVLAVTQTGSTTDEEITRSGAGFRTEPGDPEGLLDAVLKLAVDPQALKIAGARGPDYAQSSSSEREALDAFDRFVRELAVQG